MANPNPKRKQLKKHTKKLSNGRRIEMGVCLECAKVLSDKRRRRCVGCKEKKKNCKKPYVIQDRNLGEIVINPEPNAWWREEHRVRELIIALKYESTVDEACFHVGISPRQWQVFRERHPQFNEIKKLCKSAIRLKVRKKIFESVDDTFNNAMDYARRKMADEYGDKLKIDDNRREVNLTEEAEELAKKYRD